MKWGFQIKSITQNGIEKTTLQTNKRGHIDCVSNSICRIIIWCESKVTTRNTIQILRKVPSLFCCFFFHFKWCSFQNTHLWCAIHFNLLRKSPRPEYSFNILSIINIQFKNLKPLPYVNPTSPLLIIFFQIYFARTMRTLACSKVFCKVLSVWQNQCKQLFLICSEHLSQLKRKLSVYKNEINRWLWLDTSASKFSSLPPDLYDNRAHIMGNSCIKSTCLADG